MIERKPPKGMTTEMPLAPATLELITNKLREARDAKIQLIEASEFFEASKKNLRELEYEKLPKLFLTAGINELGLEPEGNKPGYHAKIEPFAHANIAKSWDDERREKAFQVLEDFKAGDLIRSTITIRLPKKSQKTRNLITQFLKKLGVEFSCQLDVPHGSLTAWVKEIMKKKGKMPPLEDIGAEVGSVCKMKEIG